MILEANHTDIVQTEGTYLRSVDSKESSRFSSDFLSYCDSNVSNDSKKFRTTEIFHPGSKTRCVESIQRVVRLNIKTSAVPFSDINQIGDGVDNFVEKIAEK